MLPDSTLSIILFQCSAWYFNSQQWLDIHWTTRFHFHACMYLTAIYILCVSITSVLDIHLDYKIYIIVRCAQVIHTEHLGYKVSTT